MTLLAISEVSVSFGGLHALSKVSLDVEPETIVGLIGPNGAGKTTLFNVVSGLQPAIGTVSFDGRDITNLPPHRRARLGISRSFQNLGLMQHESVITNVMAAEHISADYGALDLVVRPWRWWRGESTIRGRAFDILDDIGLSEHSLEQVSDLSFGVARFVELAAVLARQPRLLLLDEPTTGLDAGETERLTALLIAARTRGVTVLVVAHDVRFVMDVCDEVYVLAEGRILSHGTPLEMQRDPAVIAVYLGRPA